ncbi:hypothetical protein M5K25_019680 [Dendrobium thyrsiflorum]|uniref:Uncharacterized protein n=1 Tax=Dendrobium thyrsiflorum TaxID=117978 RepID=A0ABD0UMH1_DENTH
MKRDPRLKESKETQDRSCPLAPPRPPPELRRTTTRRPYTSPDHHLKALHFAGPPTEGPTLRADHRLKALHFAEVLPKALRSTQCPKFCLRPYAPHKVRSLPKALRSTQCPKFFLRPYAPHKATAELLPDAGVLPDYQVTPECYQFVK